MSDSQSPSNFEEISHTADAALLVYGLSLPELFSHALEGMYHIMGIDLGDQKKADDILVIRAPDPETMLVSFLSEVLFLAEKGIKVEILEIKINKNILKSKFYKIPIAKIMKEIKAVTMNEMKITKKANVFQTKIVFDL